MPTEFWTTLINLIGQIILLFLQYHLFMKMRQLERNTNSRLDELVASTSSDSFQKGMDHERRHAHETKRHHPDTEKDDTKDG